MPTARNGDVELFYETFGSPSDPTLLLVNGLGSQCINYRDAWCEMFVAEGFHVVRFDNRDVGLSTKCDGPGASDYTVADMADDAVAVLDTLGVAKAHVMGLSMGGMIVQQLAIDHPDRLLSMTSVMSHTGDTDTGRPTPEAIAHLLRAPATDRRSHIDGFLAGLKIWGSPGKVDEAALSELCGRAYDRCFCPEGQARQYQAIVRSPSRTEALRQVSVPALVMHGSADTLVDPSGGRRTADAIPGARFELIDGMGHDYPEAFWPRWTQLVADHARAASGRQP